MKIRVETADGVEPSPRLARALENLAAEIESATGDESEVSGYQLSLLSASVKPDSWFNDGCWGWGDGSCSWYKGGDIHCVGFEFD